MAFTCPRCGAVSHHPMDEREGYCGRCHDWTGVREPDDIARWDPAQGGTPPDPLNPDEPDTG